MSGFRLAFLTRTTISSREAGHITNRIDHVEGMASDVDSRAEWYLPVDARNAYR